MSEAPKRAHLVSYLIFLACLGLFGWALAPAEGFGLIAALVLALQAATAYYRRAEGRARKK